MNFYHGGPRGFQRGAFLLPPSVTGAKSTTWWLGACVHRVDRVYITTDINGALLFAAGFPRGVIYEVDPVGVLEADPDCDKPGLSYQCEKARIKRVRKVSPAMLHAVRESLCEVPK